MCLPSLASISSSLAFALFLSFTTYYLIRKTLLHRNTMPSDDKREQQGAWRPGLAESLTTDFVGKYKQLQAELEELRDAKAQAEKFQKLYEESQAEIKELLGEILYEESMFDLKLRGVKI